MQAFEVGAERAEQHVRVRVVGEVDLATAPRVAACLDAHAPDRGGAVELDLSEVEFMDSTGAHLLVKVKDAAQREGWTLAILPSEAVRRVITILGLQHELPIQPVAATNETSPGIAA